MGMLDAAALHPRLHAPATRPHYFAATARLRASAADELVGALGAGDFEPYLLHNTTSGLLAVLYAAARAGCTVRTRGPADQHYPGYHALLPPATPAAEWEFRTHVSPLTGVVDDLAGSAVQVVDAAQSLGTRLTGPLLERAAIAVAPLHKHLGLLVGMGIVLVRRNGPGLEPVHAVLEEASAGAQSAGLLRELHDALRRAGGAIFNRAEVVADEALRRWCAGRGLELLGSGRGVPFACVRTVDGTPVRERLGPTGWRHFARHDVARFAFHEPGHADSPAADRSEAFRAAVLQALAAAPRPSR